SDQLTRCITLADIAEASGRAEATIRQARLDPSTDSYRSPPEGWERAVAKLAKKRARELLDLKAALDPRRGSEGGVFLMRNARDLYRKLLADHARIQATPADSQAAFDFAVTGWHM